MTSEEAGGQGGADRPSADSQGLGADIEILRSWAKSRRRGTRGHCAGEVA
jgi:hypothetical protein